MWAVKVSVGKRSNLLIYIAGHVKTIPAISDFRLWCFKSPNQAGQNPSYIKSAESFHQSLELKHPSPTQNLNAGQKFPQLQFLHELRILNLAFRLR